MAKSNSGNYTYDGIERGAERVTQEIEEHIAELEAKGSRIRKFSMFGYSLGGLVARYSSACSIPMAGSIASSL